MATPPKITDTFAKPLPKRFYQSVGVAACDDGWTITLDGRTARTPLKKLLAVANSTLAAALAAEWAAQVGVINPALMPLTRLVTTAIDAVTGQEASVAADIASYAGTDLLCYRAETPADLVDRQRQHFDPVLAWASDAFAVTFNVTHGLMHIAQPPATTAAILRALAPHNALVLSALHVLTTMTGSAVLALAVHKQHLTLEQASAAAHVDEDWQVEKWGRDDEADARRARRLIDAEAAAFCLRHG